VLRERCCHYAVLLLWVLNVSLEKVKKRVHVMWVNKCVSTGEQAAQKGFLRKPHI
jgi:hypothetical protein